jgi:hypothetical protein
MTEHRDQSNVHKRLAAAREALERSDQAGGNETETRELRSAVRELIRAVEAATR